MRDCTDQHDITLDQLNNAHNHGVQVRVPCQWVRDMA
jgi:hypothetical protein